MTIPTRKDLAGLTRAVLLDRVSAAILEAMDITDGLDAESARRYAVAAMEELEKSGAIKGSGK